MIYKLLYRWLSLENYLRTISGIFFIIRRLGLGRLVPGTEYIYHLPELVREGDVCIDIGANLGYYARPLSKLAGPSGKVYAVEPVPVIGRVLRRNLRKCRNVEIMPYALGEENCRTRMENDSARKEGYFGTGRTRIEEGDVQSGAEGVVTFEVEMRRGSELFAPLDRLDFVKCDIEGYELHVMREMRPVLERFRPTVLIESGGDNRPQVVALFRELGYAGYTLEGGRRVPLDAAGWKDIIFIDARAPKRGRP